MSISPAMPPIHDLQAFHGWLSEPPVAERAFAAGPGVVLGLILIAALVGGAIARALATLWILVRSMLALLGSLAAAFAAVIILANVIVFNGAGPAERSPAPTAPPRPAVAPTQAAPPSHGTATVTRMLAPAPKSGHH
jgi:hypothetical protein